MAGNYRIYRLDADAPLPDWLPGLDWYSVTRTADELSIVCAADAPPHGFTTEPGDPSRQWAMFAVVGPLDFSLTGVIAGISAVLASAGIPIFTISTFDTDYLLVPQVRQQQARAALLTAGYQFDGNPE